jgi:hypothetical protein
VGLVYGFFLCWFLSFVLCVAVKIGNWIYRTLVTTDNYNCFTDIHNLQITATAAHIKSFPGNGSQQWILSCFSPYWLATLSQLMTATQLVSSLCTLGNDRVKSSFPTISSVFARVSVAADTCLSSRYQAVAVFISHHVTILYMKAVQFTTLLSVKYPYGEFYGSLLE